MFCSQKDNKKQWFIRADQICSSIWRRGDILKVTLMVGACIQVTRNTECLSHLDSSPFSFSCYAKCILTHTRRLMCGFFPPKFIHTQEPFSNMNAHGDKGFDIFKYQSLFLYPSYYWKTQKSASSIIVWIVSILLTMVPFARKKNSHCKNNTHCRVEWGLPKIFINCY